MKIENCIGELKQVPSRKKRRMGKNYEYFKQFIDDTKSSGTWRSIKNLRTSENSKTVISSISNNEISWKKIRSTFMQDNRIGIDLGNQGNYITYMKKTEMKTNIARFERTIGRPSRLYEKCINKDEEYKSIAFIN